jgi:hypothetical protein
VGILVTECDSKEHDFDGTINSTASSKVSEIKCLQCGARLNVSLQSAGRTVLPSVNIYPATGSTTISRELTAYFFIVWDETLQKLKSDGYQIADYIPTIHAMDEQSSVAIPSRKGLRLFAGILVLVSALMILLGGILPFYTYSSQGTKVSVSILAQGPNRSVDTYAAEPLTVVVLTIAAGIALLVARRRGPLGTLAGMWTLAGALLALGIQTTILFVGYAFLSLGPGVHHDAGAILGLFGGLVLIAAGTVVVIDNIRIGKFSSRS